MAKQKIEIEIDVPEGYEATGDFRCPCLGENFINLVGQHEELRAPSQRLPGPRIILRKKPKRYWVLECVDQVIDKDEMLIGIGGERFRDVTEKVDVVEKGGGEA